MKFLLVIFSVFFIATATHAQLTTSKLFGDHMVLQRNHDIPVWGRSAKKAKITVNFNSQLVAVKADEEGNWRPPFIQCGKAAPLL